MAITGGFTGKTLRVDLTTRTATVEDTLTKYGKFWGGTGMAYKILWDETTKDTKPWDPENIVHFGWGPLTATGAPCSGRTAITTLWPGDPHNAVATGHMGGHFSAEAKFAGWDSIYVVGKASGPVYIAITDSKVEIVDCPELWGEGIYKATQQITAAMGPTCQVAAIGQAGENLCVHANVMTGVSHSAGVAGSIMGSKNLKAIGVVGTGDVMIASNKKAWRVAVDNGMALIGCTYQHVVPDTPQPWAEYYNAASWWKAKKGSYWGAATPPVETGVCSAVDRNRIGYRTNIANRYFTVNGNDYCVRMDGCYGCPLRCHIAVNVPSAARWGGPTFAQNTCTGVFIGNIIPTTKYPAGVEARLRSIEAKVVGVHYGDDYGIWTHYSQMRGIWTFLYDTPANNKGVNCIKPNIINNDLLPITSPNQMNAGATTPVNEWNYLWMGTPTMQDSGKAGYNASTTAVNTDSGYPGLFTMLEAGDIGFCKEFARIVAYKIGKFGAILAGSVPDLMNTWVDNTGTALGVAGYKSTALKLWWSGSPDHHGYSAGGHPNALIQTGYNCHAQNHSWSNWSESSLPEAQLESVTEAAFGPYYGHGIAEEIDFNRSVITPMNEGKAKLAKFQILRKELHDSLGICNWSYPWWSSPRKERGYVGDLTMESQYYSLATGDIKDMMALDAEGERFYLLQRALTIRAYGSKDLRHLHDALPYWMDRANFPGALPTNNANTTQADWDTALDMFYAEFGCDLASGAPTRAKLTAVGMADVADGLKAQFPGDIWG
jgi:aldehyde:ferredoxin oxidoreductase